MGFDVVDAVGIMDGAIGLYLIHSAQTILGNKYGQLVAVVHLIQGDTQPYRILLPAPLAGFQIRILVGHDQVAAGLFPALLRRRHLREVVGKCHEIDAVVF